MFTPLAFPDGRIYLEVSCAGSHPASAELVSFEPFRGPMIVLGTIDAREYRETTNQHERLVEDGSRNVFYQRAHDGFVSAMENVQEQYHGVLLTQLIIMDSDGPEPKPWIPEGSLHLEPESQGSTTATASLMGDIISRFLGELAGHAEEMKSWASVATPLMGAGQHQRLDGDRRPEFRRRLSDASHDSRDGSPAREGSVRTSSRPSSRAFHSPSPSLNDSPRPGSSSGYSDSPYSPDPGDETPTVAEFQKSRPKYASMGQETRSVSRTMYPTSVISTSPEKERNIGKARVGISLGTLYLMAGRWADAWRELVEHTAKCRSLNDYMWVAIGLERIAVCMLLLGSEGFAFQIPTIALLGTERQSTIPFIDSNREVAPSIGPRDPDAAAPALRKLGNSLGDVAATILTYYDRAGTFAGEHLQTGIFSELILRLSKLQCAVLVSAPDFTADEVFLQGKLDFLRRTSGVKGPAAVSRLILCETLFRAYPGPFADLTASHRSLILTGIASVLSALKMERKRAMVLKELVQVLIPSLQQARKLGAAELGIHPSSSLSYTNGMMFSTDQDANAVSVRALLAQLQSSYAICETEETSPSTQLVDGANGDINGKQHQVDYERILDDVTVSIARLASLDELGSLNLKVDILRTSIEFCEALPDLSGVAQNASLLLRTAGPHSSIDPTRRDALVTLANDEQARLANLIVTITTLAQERSADFVEPLYWDKFLVRSVQLVEDDLTGKLIEHRKAEINAGSKNSFFLHEAFAKKAEKQEQRSIIVAEEPALVAVVLQNPYDFEIEVESINFVMADGELAVDPVQVMLGPRRLQEVICLATAKRSGEVKIRACKVRMIGCREEVFPIYNDDWQIGCHPRFKEAIKASTIPSALDRALAAQSQKLPQPAEVSLIIIPAQPVIVVDNVDLKSQSLTLLEGERTTFKITLRNASPSVNADFLHLSFEDSLTNSLRTSLLSKTLSRMDLYEIELEMSTNPIFSWKRLDGSDSDGIKAGDCATFEISVLGRAGVRDAKVFFDFAYLGEDRDASTFYTRQLVVDVNVSVSPCVEIQHFEVMRLGPTTAKEEDLSRDGAGSGLCLLVLDIRNAWSHALDVDLRLHSDVQSESNKDQSKMIPSNQTARFVLLMQKLFVKMSHAQIPWISSQSRRQFVVSTAAETASQQRAMREAFWYREELLKALTGSWRDTASGRQGRVNMRVLNLGQQHLESLRADDLEISYNVTPQDGNHEAVKRTGGSTFHVDARAFLSFRVDLANRSDKSIQVMLRMMPMVANQGADSSADMTSRRLMWSGVLQRPIPAIMPGESRTAELGFCVLSAGTYNVGVVAEEIRPAQEVERDESPSNQRDDEDVDVSDKMPAMERRVWRTPDLCCIRTRQ